MRCGVQIKVTKITTAITNAITTTVATAKARVITIIIRNLPNGYWVLRTARSRKLQLPQKRQAKIIACNNTTATDDKIINKQTNLPSGGSCARGSCELKCWTVEVGLWLVKSHSKTTGTKTTITTTQWDECAILTYWQINLMKIMEKRMAITLHHNSRSENNNSNNNYNIHNNLN